jgi:hypothetical protein
MEPVTGETSGGEPNAAPTDPFIRVQSCEAPQLKSLGAGVREARFGPMVTVAWLGAAAASVARTAPTANVARSFTGGKMANEGAGT